MNYVSDYFSYFKLGQVFAVNEFSDCSGLVSQKYELVFAVKELYFPLIFPQTASSCRGSDGFVSGPALVPHSRHGGFLLQVDVNSRIW